MQQCSSDVFGTRTRFAAAATAAVSHTKVSWHLPNIAHDPITNGVGGFSAYASINEHLQSPKGLKTLHPYCQCKPGGLVGRGNITNREADRKLISLAG